MVDMATDRKKAPVEPPEPPTRFFSMNMATPLYKVMEQHSKKERRNKKDTVEIALEEYFERLGLWPPGETKS